jgi:hypothetical protein
MLHFVGAIGVFNERLESRIGGRSRFCCAGGFNSQFSILNSILRGGLLDVLLDVKLDVLLAKTANFLEYKLTPRL